MTTKTVKQAVPKVSAKISPLESVFEVSMEGSTATSWGFDDFYKFSISADGTVTINDNVFNSKKEAAKALKAISDFLAK
jgi:hypothetical protein